MTFTALCDRATRGMATPWAFGLSLLAWPAWLGLGERSGKVIDVVTILSFNVLFVILHTSSRDNLALQLKTDELVKGTPGARDELAGVEDLDVAEVERRRKET